MDGDSSKSDPRSVSTDTRRHCSGKQRARKFPYSSARAPHSHLLQRSYWLRHTSVTLRPASRPLALVNGGECCSVVNAIRRRARFMPALGRKAPVVFMRRARCSVVDFDWSRFSLRHDQEPSSRTRLVSWQEALLRGLKPSRCPHCSPSVLFSVCAASLRERCNDKSRICGSLYTYQAGKYLRNSLNPVLLAPQPYPRLRAEPEGERFNCLYPNPTRK